MKMSSRFVVLVVTCTLGFGVFGAITHNAISTVKVNGPIYDRIVRGKDLVADILPPPEYILESYLVAHQMLLEKDLTEANKLADRFKSLRSDFDTRHEYWGEKLPDGPMKQTLLVKSYTPAVAFFKTLDTQFIPAIKAGDKPAAESLLMGSMAKSYAEHRSAIDEVVVAANAQALEDEKEANSVVASRVALMLTVGVATTLLLVATVWLIYRTVAGPLRTLNTRLRDIADGEGDLTQRVDATRKDELGELAASFNTFVQKIETVILEVKSGTAQIDSGAGQISSASQSLAEGASEQAASLEQISASVEQMSAMTQQNAENARQANAMAEAAKKSADKGQSEMKQMVAAMGQIKDSSAEIAKIIKVIDEIAFQTNLLALNAAVEAARAGEAGKGFAVVAEEVRSLAQRSAEAAKSTSSMIEQSTKRADNGVDIAGRVGVVLDEIAGSTHKVNTLLAEIASASAEQASGISQVNTGISQLDKVTQQNAGNSEELASSAEETAAQVAALQGVVCHFHTSDSLGHSHSTLRRPGDQMSKAKPTPKKSPTPRVTPAANPGAGTSNSPLTKRQATKAAAQSALHTPHASPKPPAKHQIPLTDDEELASF